MISNFQSPFLSRSSSSASAPMTFSYEEFLILSQLAEGQKQYDLDLKIKQNPEKFSSVSIDHKKICESLIKTAFLLINDLSSNSQFKIGKELLYTSFCRINLEGLKIVKLSANNHYVPALHELRDYYLTLGESRLSNVYELLSSIVENRCETSLTTTQLESLESTEEWILFFNAMRVNATVKTLELFWSDKIHIGEEEAKTIARALEQNSSLTSISFKNEMCSASTMHLAKTLSSKPTLTFLSIDFNRIESDETLPIFAKIVSNPSLTSLFLHNCKWPQEQEVMRDSLIANTRLITFNGESLR